TVGPLVDNPEAVLEPVVNQEIIDDLVQQRDTAIAGVKTAWRDGRDDVIELLNQSKSLSRAVSNFRLDKLATAFAALDEFIDTDPAPLLLPEGFELLASEKIHAPKSLKKNQVAPEHPFFDKAQGLIEIWNRWERYYLASLLIEASDYIRTEMDRRKTLERILFFDDLLSKLDQALSGKGRTALSKQIRARYPVVMIDEFQDTDPLQYRIFHRIYRDEPDCGLLMIGDPKQAIYSFRGADIFTYMQARRDTHLPEPGGEAPTHLVTQDVDRQQTGSRATHFTLGINWRSHSRLVDGVNRLFENGADPFIYAEDIGFYSVEPAGRADQEPLSIDGKIPEPLVAWFVPLDDDNQRQGTIPKTWASPHVAAGCASEIAHLLNLGRKGLARIGKDHLVARDMAVLVRNRYEAVWIRDALNSVGISSVYISRDSVFETDEARDLSHLLRAIAEPGHPALLRTALATRCMGWSADRIQALDEDEMEWDVRVMAFHEYHRLWRIHGFMPMFHTLMRREGIIGHLLSHSDGSRRMTNLLQLAELAQVASRSRPGIENLLHWLADARSQPNGNSEEQQLRLESDEELVKIVTIHKSKGLEYPIVFIPYIWSSRREKNRGIITFHDQESRRLHADLGSENREVSLALAERERLAEDLRLLYVAITRAKYRCYFSWGPFNGAADSGMAWLLHQHRNELSGTPVCNMDSLDNEGIRAALEELNDGESPRVLITELPDHGESLIAPSGGDENVRALHFHGRIKQLWSMTSFSGLTAGMHQGHEFHIDLPDYDSEQAPPPRSAEQLPLRTRFTFPRGARAGEFLHSLFENIDFPSAGGEALSAMVARKLEQYGFDEVWRAVVAPWVTAVLDTPLDPSRTLSLRCVTDDKRLVEMPFQYPLTGLTPEGLNGALRSASIPGDGDPGLVFSTVRGMMKGFIDLVFEHSGRFYVLDYKSNHLGDTLEEYKQGQLVETMRNHHYELQYLIYVVALHRYLKQRLPDYDYESHCGGVYYLFLRGMDPETGLESGVFFHRPEAALIDKLDRLFSGEVKELPDA
ncbi:MAG: UvrD-helicase domain-containing protein, partial [Gammaproteobacteria bacterium]|nr:UvrD-helicase domain-containing protein [Gammaproteobacteria bacterium]